MATPTSLPATFVAGNVLTAAQMNALRGAFRILQVVSTTKTDTFSTSSNTFVDITGLSVSITPTSTDSDILVIATINQSVDGTGQLGYYQLTRAGTAIAIGDTASNRARVSVSSDEGAATDRKMDSLGITYLDSPATTSATTYQVQGLCTSGTILINRSKTDGDFNYYARTVSTITVMEVSA